jgi:hypothetical protein
MYKKPPNMLGGLFIISLVLTIDIFQHHRRINLWLFKSVAT